MNNLSTQEKVDLIAIKLMRWKLKNGDVKASNGAMVGKVCWMDGDIIKGLHGNLHRTFNPFESWEDCHTVLDKVIEDEELFVRFANAIPAGWLSKPHRMDDNLLAGYMKASKETLMDTLISILSEQDE